MLLSGGAAVLQCGGGGIITECPALARVEHALDRREIRRRAAAGLIGVHHVGRPFGYRALEAWDIFSDISFIVMEVEVERDIIKYEFLA